MQRYIVWLCLTAMLLAILTAFFITDGTAHAQSAARPSTGHDPLVTIRSDRQSLTIVERFSKVVKFTERVARVDGFDPGVIGVTALSPTELRVQALAPGVTTMVVIDENDRIYSIEVFITGDVRHLQAYIDRFFPNASVQAVAVHEAVVLRGWVTNPEHITEMMEIAEQFYDPVLNQMKVGGVQQVLLKVKVIEAQRSKIRRLGMNWAFSNQKSFVASAPGMLTPVSAITSALGVAPTVSLEPTSLRNSIISFGITGTDDAFNGFIEALKQESLLKILAEPELITMNGRPATLLAGGEFPILVPQSLGTVTIEWREFGTRLEMVPIILGNGTLRLELQPEVSDRDFSNAVTVLGTVVPGLTTRRVNTQVEMRFGQTLMIAGLLSSRKTAVVDKIPFFGELPWIGFAFSRKRYDESETELVILVTPELVAPLEKHQVIPGGPGRSSETPTDHEFMGYGFLEVPNYGDGCYGCDSQPYGDVYPTPDHNNYPTESSGSLRIAPEGTYPGNSAPPVPSGNLSPSETAVPPDPSTKPGLVLPQVDSPAVGPRVPAPATESVGSDNSPTAGNDPNWWIGERMNPRSRRGPHRQAGYSNDQQKTAVQRTGMFRPLRATGPLRTSGPITRGANDRQRRPARSRLIEPRLGLIEPVSGGN